MRTQLAALVVASTLAISMIAACGSSDGAGGIDPSLGTGNEGGDGTVDPTTGGGDGGAADGSDDGASGDGADDGASGDGASADGAGGDAAVDAGLTVWPAACMLCHGSVNPAPPKPFHAAGGNATTNRFVGAHQSHLGPSSWHHEVACTECHIVPTDTSWDPLVPTHMNGVSDLTWGPLAKSGVYSATTETCSATYCHGSTLKTDAPGLGSNRNPKWTTVDGSQKECGTSCHTLPPGGGHTTNTACPTCHTAVIASFVAGNPPAVVWKDASLHINGQVELAGGALTCTSCHGTVATNSPAPPRGTKGELTTAEQAVGAHAKHLGASTWHRDGQCTDCHTLPASTAHSNGVTDFTWGAVSTASGAAPNYTPGTATCGDVYCHGSKLIGPRVGGVVSRSPVWNVVNGSFSSCGNTCHTNPPAAPHTQQTSCPSCHTAVVATYDPVTTATTWADRSLHINGSVEVIALTCTSCHGTVATNSPAPPRGTKGELATADKAVGAHAQHLTASTWHRNGQCADCHTLPVSTGHSNGVTDFTWGAVSTASGAAPNYTPATATCGDAYCHGSKLLGPNAGGVVKRSPVWNVVNGTYNSCGNTCHTNPPGGNHTQQTSCPTCHTAVIATYDPVTKTATWVNSALHINGGVEVDALTCTSCHGTVATNTPEPPRGTHNELTTADKAVGAHTQHLSASTWHRDGQCNDCHTLPASTAHTNGVTDFTWGPVSTASGAAPNYTPATATCADAYCHGSKLLGARAGGVVSRSPVWNVVNGSYDSCGNTCHTNPPGGTHPQQTGCPKCHSAVVATYDPATLVTTWTDRTLHINGSVEVEVTCTSCHGTGAAQVNPPVGVGGEATTNTLAVGRHTAHLTASASHLAVACNTCHVVPGAGDVAHTAGYVASASLAAPGHHGDVTFANQAVGMAFDVNATQGAPVTARGTCLGACHSNGRGGAPAVTPYWAGGAWPAGCGGCHAGTMQTLPGRHPTHNGEAACTDCHTPANSATHMNGVRNVNAAIVGNVPGGGGGVVTLAPGAPGNNCAAGQVQCNGTCHGKGHAPRCW